MDIALIDRKTGRIENVISGKRIEDAQRGFPDLDCVVRRDLMLEPGGTYVKGVVTRAPQVVQQKDDTTSRIEILEAKVDLIAAKVATSGK